jgi:hypothetical protein
MLKLNTEHKNKKNKNLTKQVLIYYQDKTIDFICESLCTDQSAWNLS